MVRFVRLFVVAAVVLVTGIANAQDCATAAAPQCGGTCAVFTDVCQADFSSGAAVCGCVPAQALTIKKLSIKLNFAKPSSDSIQLQGTLEVPSDFDPAGATVVVDVGGVIRSFTLDEKGKSKVDYDQAQIKKPKDGLSKYAVKIAKGSFSTTLADEGLTDTTVKDFATEVGVGLDVNAAKLRKLQPQLYTAKQGKSGKTK